ncbi:MAG: Spo0B domain-containing protein [Lachnospiraceae bacterium]|nr:Spo0B domain-containing protein [Lachnospiraceae bacterium]
MSMELIFCLVAVLVLAVCMAVVLILHKKQRLHLLQLQESLKNLEQLNFELRAARHDYLNHLQVVYGLLELEEYEDLKKYLTPVYKGIMKTGKALKTSKPALNALLKAKMEEAEGKEIDVYVEVKSDLQKLPVEDWQLCKVLSNLIDNAMTALSETTEERKLEIDINEDRENYLFTVSNNGTAIPKEHLENIFKRGFSTKKESGHGMGLAIVSDIVKENRGNISVSSTEERTSFAVSFQKGEGK